MYSQSRSKAIRKSRNNQIQNDDNEKKLQKSPIRQGVWELRGGNRNNEAKKLRNTREYTETVFSSEICSVTHEKPNIDQITATAATTTATSTTTPNNAQDLAKLATTNLLNNMTLPGEVVVFDDIDDNWQMDDINKHDNDINHTATTNLFNTDTDCDKVTKVIGNLPIAVYEGSPRRYGPRQMETNCTHPQLPSAQSLLASPSVYPPRPGFPQRVVSTPSPNEDDLPTIENNTYSVRVLSVLHCFRSINVAFCLFRKNYHLRRLQSRRRQQHPPSTICTNSPRRAKC